MLNLKRAIREMVFLSDNISSFFDMIIFEWRDSLASFTIDMAIFSGSDAWHEVAE
jgi:hypothetical protein